MTMHVRRRARLAVAATGVAALLGLCPAPAGALTGGDGLIAVGTDRGIEVFDSAGNVSDMHVLIPRLPDALPRNPTWSPTGDLIAYHQGSGIWVARADGTGARLASFPDEAIWYRPPAWSPDGRLAYNSSGGTVTIIDPNGRHKRIIDGASVFGRTGSWVSAALAWTTDGRLLLQAHDSGAGLSGYYLVDGDGTDPELLMTKYRDEQFSAGMDLRWDFASNGTVGIATFDPNDGYAVYFTALEGHEMLYEVGGWAGNHDSDVALSPSGNRAVMVSPPGSYEGAPVESTIHSESLGATRSDAIDHNFWFKLPGKTYGLAWQPQCTVTGTPEDDILYGTAGPDLICGYGGDDTILAAGGNDVIFAGDGNDIVRAGGGRDVVVGGPGIDQLWSGRGNDLINTQIHDHKTADEVHAGRGRNTCLTDKSDTRAHCKA